MQARPDRIVSLAPSATASLAAMGAGDAVVGVTSHCDPDPLPGVPAVVGGWLNPAPERVRDLDPDLVCTSDALQSDLAEAFRERGFAVHHAEPTRLEAVLESMADLGAAAGRSDAAETLVADCRARIERVREAVADRERPVVYCEEWSDPPMAAGNWVPDAVRAAGGRYPFVDAGKRSHEVSAAAVRRTDPAHAVLHVCGYGDRSDPATFDERGWDLDATVHVLDDSLLNQPGPRLVDGVEELARRIHGIDPGATGTD